MAGNGTEAAVGRTIRAVTTYDRPFGRYLEDFEVGDIYKHWPGKTITEYDDHLFCMITMNHHPLHTNEWFAEHETVHGKNVVVGNLVYSLVLGMSVPDVSRRGHRQPRGRDADSTRSRPSTATPSTPRPGCSSKRVDLEARPGHRHRRDQGHQPARRRGLLLPRKVMVWKKAAGPERRRPYDEADDLGVTA